MEISIKSISQERMKELNILCTETINEALLSDKWPMATSDLLEKLLVHCENEHEVALVAMTLGYTLKN